MYGIVKCLPVSRRKSTRPSPPSQSRLLTMTRATGSRREVQEALQLRPNRDDVGAPACPRSSSVPFRGRARTGRRSSPCRHRPARRAGRRGAATGGARRSAPGCPTWSDGAEGSNPMYAEIGRPPASRAASPGVVAVQDAPPLQLTQQPARRGWRSTPLRGPGVRPASRLRRLDSSQPARPSRHDPRRGARPLVHASYAIVRPQMQTSLARRRRLRRAIARRPGGPGRCDHRNHRPRCCLSGTLIASSVFAGFIGLLVLVGGYNHFSQGLPEPVAALARHRV